MVVVVVVVVVLRDIFFVVYIDRADSSRVESSQCTSLAICIIMYAINRNEKKREERRGMRGGGGIF
jgi:uncharacterized membrane protein (DUF373 family)